MNTSRHAAEKKNKPAQQCYEANSFTKEANNKKAKTFPHFWHLCNWR